MSMESPVGIGAHVRQILSSAGYGRYYLAFGDGNLRLLGWRMHAWKLPEPLKSLVRLFLLTEPVEADGVRRVLGKAAFDVLSARGVLRFQGQDVCTDGYILILFQSLFLFIRCAREPRVYFGCDSMALATWQTRAPGGRTLDLCAGSGVQAMLAALYARRVEAVEADPTAASIARLNVVLNGLDDKVRIIEAPLEHAVTGRGRFDVITANPPFEPTPPELAGPLFASGGLDGLSVVQRIMERYLPRLKRNGVLEFVGIGLGKHRDYRFAHRLQALGRRQGASGDVWITGKERLVSGATYYDSLVAAFSVYNRRPIMECYRLCKAHWRRLDVNELYLYRARFQPCPAQLDRSMRVTDLSGTRCQWFVPGSPEDFGSAKILRADK